MYGSKSMNTQSVTSILFEQDDVESSLRQLGLTKSKLEDALMWGVQERLNCGPLLPTTFPGAAQWAYTIEGFRHQVGADGWTVESHQNLPVTIAPDESFAIVVYTGDKDTGLRHGHPTNKAKKGLKAQQAVLRNTKSGELFPETLQPQQEPAKNVLKTWVLLYHLDATNPKQPVLRSELSLPSKFDQKLGKILDWEIRIILDEIDLSDDPEIVKTYVDEPEIPLDIPVRRKTA
ncbi:hypothetical protein DBR44_16355 [Aquitalea sp. FJL05]|nr:hypothetical protein DBR44_16355 [Aquitalea sp. FJL05]